MATTETILYADDDDNDHFLVTRTLKQLSTPVEIHCVGDGVEAVEYLSGAGQFVDRSLFPIPTLMFLDIKMPRMGGFEVLAWIKEHAVFKALPVVMVSSSNQQPDVDRAYKLGASAYIVKPAKLEDFRKLFKATGEFFLEHAEKPSIAAL